MGFVAPDWNLYSRAAAAAGTALAAASLPTAKAPREMELGPPALESSRDAPFPDWGDPSSIVQLQLAWAVQQAEMSESLSGHWGVMACAAV